MIDNCVLYQLEEVDSTSRFLKEIMKINPHYAVCYAGVQTSGYGQHGRTWVSDQKSLTFSISFGFNRSVNELDGLSAFVAHSIAVFFRENYDFDLKLKWPNDIYDSKGKLSGILLESVKSTSNSCWIVIGIGINLNSDYSDHLELRASSLSIIEDKFLVFQSLFKHLMSDLHVFNLSGLPNDFPLLWRRNDLILVKAPVLLTLDGNRRLGFYLGITERAELKIMTAEFYPEVITIRSGYCSMLPLYFLE